MAVRENLFECCQGLFLNYFQPLAVTENTHVWRERPDGKEHLDAATAWQGAAGKNPTANQTLTSLSKRE